MTPFQPPHDGFGVALLSLELDYVSKRRATAAEYDAKALAKHILARYVGQARIGSPIPSIPCAGRPAGRSQRQ